MRGPSTPQMEVRRRLRYANILNNFYCHVRSIPLFKFRVQLIHRGLDERWAPEIIPLVQSRSMYRHLTAVNSVCHWHNVARLWLPCKKKWISTDTAVPGSGIHYLLCGFKLLQYGQMHFMTIRNKNFNEFGRFWSNYSQMPKLPKNVDCLSNFLQLIDLYGENSHTLYWHSASCWPGRSIYNFGQ